MITLRTFTPADFVRLKSWIDSEAMLQQFAGPIFRYPLTNKQLHTYIEKPNRHAFAVMYQSRNIGHAEITLLENNTARLCRILIGETGDRGKGLGEQIIQALVDLCWNTFDAEEIELNVYEWNTAAIRCYEKVGFVRRLQQRPADTASQIISMVLNR